MRWTRTGLLLALCALMALAVFGCSGDQPSPVTSDTNGESTPVQGSPILQAPAPIGVAQGLTVEERLMQLMTNVNTQLEAAGAGYRVAVAEWLGTTRSEEDIRTVFYWNVGNKQLAHHFVPGDPRRAGWSTGTAITYRVDVTQGNTASGLTTAQTTAAIDRAMSTWQNVQCSTIPLVRGSDLGFDVGVVEFQNGLGGFPAPVADITHAGWLAAGILNPNVIGVTFTYWWVNGGVPTDVDNNGKRDTAFREIYYNDAFDWQIDPGCALCLPVDVETIALHEAGHGLSQGHFGSAFFDGSGVNTIRHLHFGPLSVMNAGYVGENQVITQSDLAGHCSIWAQWPNN